MEREVYADQVSNIYVNGNMVRIDFVSLNPSLQDQNGQPVFSLSSRVVMPLEGFTKAFAMHQDIIGKLLENGVLRINPPEGDSVPETEQ